MAEVAFYRHNFDELLRKGPWGDGECVIGGASVVGERFFLHILHWPANGAERSMYLAEYGVSERKVISSVRVGIPGRISASYAASRTLYADGHLYLAWIEEHERTEVTHVGKNGEPIVFVETKDQVVLTKWKIGAPAAVHLPIRQTIGDNSALDIAMQGTKL
jgi:hypothetical protein